MRQRKVDLEKIRKELDEALTFFDFSKAEKLLEKGLKFAEQQNNKFYQMFFKSQEAIIDDDYDRALNYLNKALKINPYDAECYNDKSLCLVDLDRINEALWCVEDGIKICGQSKLLYHNRGWIFMQEGSWKNAMINFRKALEFDDGYSVCWANLAECLKQEADLDSSLKCYEKALELIPAKYKRLRKEISGEVGKLKQIIHKKK